MLAFPTKKNPCNKDTISFGTDEWQKPIAPGDHIFKEDLEEGRYIQADLLWRAALKRAGDLSRMYTPSLGCRSLDVLHVASALELELKNFLTFDQNLPANSLGNHRSLTAFGLARIMP